MSNRYKVKFSYNGYQYNGWQVQPNVRTVQGEILRTLKDVFKVKPLKFIGASRTDAHVHALSQNSLLEIAENVSKENLLEGLNRSLPSDISVLEISKAQDDYHPIYHSQSKEYNYLIKKGRVTPWDYQYCVEAFNLDWRLIEESLELFIGEHDFSNFQCKGTPVKSTVRTITGFEIISLSNSALRNVVAEDKGSEYFVFKIAGNGFLKQMVRLIMGSLISVGSKQITLEELENIIANRIKKRAGKVMPGHGLFLIQN